MRKSSPGTRKSLSGDSPRRPGLSLEGIDSKKIKLMAVSVVIGSILLLTVVLVAITVLGNKGPDASATPVPSVTPEPSASPTVTPAPTPTPKPTPASGQVYDNSGPFMLSAYLNGATGQSRIGLTLSPGAATVDVNKLTMSVLCEGKTYDNVWSLKPKDWSQYDNDTILEHEEGIVADIDTVKLGIPQGKPLTVRVLKNGDLMQEISVAPTYL